MATVPWPCRELAGLGAPKSKALAQPSDHGEQDTLLLITKD